MKHMYEKLKNKANDGLEKMSVDERKDLLVFCRQYVEFLNGAKTEREACRKAIEMVEQAGFVPLKNKQSLAAGDKIYIENRGKCVMVVVVGQDLSEGVSVVGAHIDSPRLDLKQNPLFESDGLAYFKTCYYGGVRKYHWFSIPLAIHGIIVKTDGTKIDICIGEDEKDPVFCITDLLPHLAKEHLDKKVSEAFPGEVLNVLLGSETLGSEEIGERAKFNILKLLNDKYEITEEDFTSAEIEIVPAWLARDLGIDRSMIAGYGHDDRVCAYGALRAILDVENPKRTAVALIVDKEEIGSMGNTGMQSRFFEHTLIKMRSLKENSNDISECLSNSECLSADVGAAFDPNFPDVSEKHNVAVLNGGIMISKYSGGRGKSGSSDASAEFVAKIRGIFGASNVVWQTGDLGKVDMGGGGTIAQYVANLNMDVLDCGVPVLSMHSPFEVVSKFDVYMSYKAYRAFLNFK